MQFAHFRSNHLWFGVFVGRLQHGLENVQRLIDGCHLTKYGMLLRPFQTLLTNMRVARYFVQLKTVVTEFRRNPLLSTPETRVPWQAKVLSLHPLPFLILNIRGIKAILALVTPRAGPITDFITTLCTLCLCIGLIIVIIVVSSTIGFNFGTV